MERIDAKALAASVKAQAAQQAAAGLAGLGILVHFFAHGVTSPLNIQVGDVFGVLLDEFLAGVYLLAHEQ